MKVGMAFSYSLAPGLLNFLQLAQLNKQQHYTILQHTKRGSHASLLADLETPNTLCGSMRSDWLGQHALEHQPSAYSTTQLENKCSC